MHSNTNKKKDVAPRQVLQSMNEHLAAIHCHLVNESTLRADTPAQPSEQAEFLKQLTRTLLVSGNGERLDRAIRELIRHYGEAREEIRRFQSHDEITEELRGDIVAGFTRFLTKFQEDLVLLGVCIEEVQIGDALDVQLHRIVDRVSTGDDSHLDTVAECIRPAFRWRGLDGKEHREPALVAVYGALEKRKRKGR